MARPVVCVIPARFGAVRFPGKLLADLDGRPVLHHVVSNALSAESVSRVVVATDDERLAEAARLAGAETFESRRDHATGSDRIAEACDALGVTGHVVNVQGDEPFLAPEAIDACVGALRRDEGAEIATLATPASDEETAEPSVVKVAIGRDGRALYFSRAPVPWTESGGSRLKHVGIYAYREGALARFAALERGRLEVSEKLEQLRALEAGWKIAVEVGPFDTIGIDTPQDLERANEMCRQGQHSGNRKGSKWRALSL